MAKRPTFINYVGATPPIPQPWRGWPVDPAKFKKKSRKAGKGTGAKK